MTTSYLDTENDNDIDDNEEEEEEELANLPSTVKFFPNLSDLLDDEEYQDDDDDDGTNNNNTVINEWALRKFGTLQMKLEKCNILEIHSNHLDHEII